MTLKGECKDSFRFGTFYTTKILRLFEKSVIFFKKKKWWVCLFPKDVIRNHHKLGALSKQQKFILSQSGGWTSRVRVLAGLCSQRLRLRLRLQGSLCSCWCSHSPWLVAASLASASAFTLLLLLYKDTCLWVGDPGNPG